MMGVMVAVECCTLLFFYLYSDSVVSLQMSDKQDTVESVNSSLLEDYIFKE